MVVSGLPRGRSAWATPFPCLPPYLHPPFEHEPCGSPRRLRGSGALRASAAAARPLAGVPVSRASTRLLVILYHRIRPALQHQARRWTGGVIDGFPNTYASSSVFARVGVDRVARRRLRGLQMS